MNHLPTCIILLAVLSSCSSVLGDEPIRVYVLAGQSNMQGKGSVQHLATLLQNNLTRDNYKHLVKNDQNEFAERDDVLVYYPEVSQDEFLPLAPGLGHPASDRFGPELEFGHAVGDAGGNVLLIKVAFGGKDLAVDFRPPSRGSNTYTRLWKQGDDVKLDGGRTVVTEEEYHVSYVMMVNTVLDILKRIEAGDVFGGQTTWDLKGLVWWQGWNDLVVPRKVDEYEDNLKALIRDVRLDLNETNLPIVLGELGQHGLHPHGGSFVQRVYKMRRAERNVALSDEFRKTVRFAMTSPYVVQTGDRFDGDYHYYGRADTVVQVGRAFGQTMLQLLEDISLQNLEIEE